MDQLTPAQRAVIERRLETGERLLWAAGTRQGVQLSAFGSGFIGIPFLVVGGVPLVTAIRHLSTVFDEQNGFLAFLIFAAFGLVFTGVGLLLIRQAFATQADAGATLWVVTDRRIFRLITRGTPRVLNAAPLRLVTRVDIVEQADGSGMLGIVTTPPEPVPGKRVTRRQGRYLITGVKDVAAARATIQAAVDRATASAAA